VGEQAVTSWATTSVTPGGPGSRHIMTRRGEKSNELRETGGLGQVLAPMMVEVSGNVPQQWA